MARQRGHSVVKQAESLNLERDEWLSLVTAWINNERDRFIIRRHILDGRTYNQINDELEAMGEYPLSDRRLATIISKGMDKISSHL